jgi:hypothetical protein
MYIHIHIYRFLTKALQVRKSATGDKEITEVEKTRYTDKEYNVIHSKKIVTRRQTQMSEEKLKESLGWS